MKQLKNIISILLAFGLLIFTASTVFAADTSVMGVHILNTSEVGMAHELLNPEEAERWHYVTVPFTLEDVEKKDQWQSFFNEAKSKKLIPLVRLTTRFENGAWAVPNRAQIIRQIDALAALEWPTEQKHIIIFNEVNHAKEWGGTIDPVGYARVFEFAARWAHTADKQFVVLPAAMDLAAPNGSVTMEAFTYLSKMHEHDQSIFKHADAWNSHSYPNPAFSAPPTATGKNSLRGFEHELAYLADKTDKQLEVYITETGWETNGKTQAHLVAYYEYALEHVWSHPKVRAVTPFILKGSPGPFARFSFLDGQDKPTAQYVALQQAFERVAARRLAQNQ